MKLNTALKVSTLALVLTAVSTQAADPGTLKTIGNSEASFAAGATINGGAAFQNVIPAWVWSTCFNRGSIKTA